MKVAVLSYVLLVMGYRTQICVEPLKDTLAVISEVGVEDVTASGSSVVVAIMKYQKGYFVLRNDAAK